MQAIVIDGFGGDGFGGAGRLRSAEVPAAAGGGVLPARLSRAGHVRDKTVLQVG